MIQFLWSIPERLNERKQAFLILIIKFYVSFSDIIDPAVLRPGRMDKILYVGIPLPEDRVAILKTITRVSLNSLWTIHRYYRSKIPEPAPSFSWHVAPIGGIRVFPTIKIRPKKINCLIVHVRPTVKSLPTEKVFFFFFFFFFFQSHKIIHFVINMGWFSS